MKLSANLSLAEVIRSDIAKRLGISNYPTENHLERLKNLAQTIFQPIRDHYGVPIYISSGYRSKELNAATPGASSRSQHCRGEALDIDMDISDDGITNADIFNYIKDNLDFDQLVAEFPFDGQPAWVHVSRSMNGPQRHSILISRRVDKEIHYFAYEGEIV